MGDTNECLVVQRNIHTVRYKITAFKFFPRNFDSRLERSV